MKEQLNTACIDLLKTEAGFTERMEGEIEPYVRTRLTDGIYTSDDGKPLHWLHFEADAPKAAVLLVHGFSEFWEKYFEMLYYFLQCGYSVWMPELRGHGGSVREVDEPYLVHIDSFRTYVKDIKRFFNEKIASEPLPTVLMGHSMGGALAGLYAEAYPDDFSAVVLSSPMVRIRSGGLSIPAMKVLSGVCKAIGKGKSYVFGKGPFTGKEDFEGSSCDSPGRYAYTFGKRKQDIKNQTWSPSYSWLGASARAHTYILENAGKIRARVLVMYAMRDGLVDPAGTPLFCEKIPDCRVECFDNAKHEIFNSDEESRLRYYKKLFEFLEESV